MFGWLSLSKYHFHIAVEPEPIERTRSEVIMMNKLKRGLTDEE